MKTNFEEHEMQIIIFDRNDAMCDAAAITSNIRMSNMYGGTDGNWLYVEPDDM